MNEYKLFYKLRSFHERQSVDTPCDHDKSTSHPLQYFFKIFVLSYHPRQRSEGLIPVGFLAQILHEIHFCHMYGPSHNINTLHDLITHATNYEALRFANFPFLLLLSIL